MGSGLFGLNKTGVVFERHEGHEFQHVGLGEGEAGKGLLHLGLGCRLPQDGGAGRVSATPHLAEDAGGVEFPDAAAFAGEELGGKGFGWKSIGATAAEAQELHLTIVRTASLLLDIRPASPKNEAKPKFPSLRDGAPMGNGESKAAASGIHVERYLGYLDKEMTIMGILSGFCIATLGLSIKVLADKPDLASRLWSGCPVPFVLAHLMLLAAALSFYRQRSLLAWYYGQIALQDSGYSTGFDLGRWLRDADGWDTWMNYQRGFWLLGGCFCETLVAASAFLIRLEPARASSAIRWVAIVLAAMFAACILIQKLILQKWAHVEDPYAEFRNHPLSLFD